jgi:predicted O-linked N-acetylglucosamine transferase (SPINDLY family)
MKDNIDETKLALYKKLTEEINETEESFFNLKNIIKGNHKYIRELRDDISRWKETCYRQDDKIHRYFLITIVQGIALVIFSILTIVVFFS